jgi:hypothetical protein
LRRECPAGEVDVRALFGLCVVVLLVSPGFVAPAAAQCNMWVCCNPVTGQCCPDNDPTCMRNRHSSKADVHHRHKHAATPKLSHAPKDKTQYLRYQ